MIITAVVLYRTMCPVAGIKPQNLQFICLVWISSVHSECFRLLLDSTSLHSRSNFNFPLSEERFIKEVTMGASQASTDQLRVIMYSAMQYEEAAFKEVLRNDSAWDEVFDIVFVSARLDGGTVSLAKGARAICLFASDRADAQLLKRLRNDGVELIVTRYAGVSCVDVAMAEKLGFKIARTPAHAPTSIAEYTIALMLALIRKIHAACNRVRDGNLSLHGLVGFDISEKTVGIIGTGKVGQIVTRILTAFGCRVLAFDMKQSQEVMDMGGTYVSLEDLLRNSDILTLHAPLVRGTHHLIGRKTIPRCKTGVHIVNTAGGGLIDVKAVIEGLRVGQIGGLAIDVYEGESSVFFRDHTGEVVDFDIQILKSMPNVLITCRQAGLTTNALGVAARATVKTLQQFHRGEELEYEHISR